jgi:uncharacterized phage-like protein YoqJ
MIVIAGTGHRPNKLGGYGLDAFNKLARIAELFLTENRPDVVIIGMALGWDQALAVAAIRLGIPLKAYVPFLGQESKWPKDSQQLYHLILEECQEVKVCSEGSYNPYKMQLRNEMMVNDCTNVLAMWDGTEGGTANCIRYAKKVGKPITNLYEKFKT